MGKKSVKRVDVFGMSAEMKERVAKFLECKVYGVELSRKYNAKIRTYESVLADKADPTRVWISEDLKQDAINRATIDLAEVKAEYARLRKEFATFELSDADKAFKKGWKSAENGAEKRTVVRAWASSLNLNIVGTDLESAIMKALSGEDPNTTRNFVNTGMCNADSRKESVALKLMYGKVADYMVLKGLAVPVEFSDELKAYYAPKAKKSTK